MRTLLSQISRPHLPLRKIRLPRGICLKLLHWFPPGSPDPEQLFCEHLSLPGLWHSDAGPGLLPGGPADAGLGWGGLVLPRLACVALNKGLLTLGCRGLFCKLGDMHHPCSGATGLTGHTVSQMRNSGPGGRGCSADGPGSPASHAHYHRGNLRRPPDSRLEDTKG